MPIPTPAQPFGRRNLPPGASARTASPRTTNAQRAATMETAPDDAVLKFAAEMAANRQTGAQSVSDSAARIVPHSILTTTLAGFLAASLHVSVTLGSIAFGPEIGSTYDSHLVPNAALLISASLWAGARASFLSIMFVRWIMSRLQITQAAAYTLCGGLVSLVYSLILHCVLHTQGPVHVETLALDAATGLAAGFFYRIFAGTRAA